MVILGHLFLFCPNKTPKLKFWKMKKIAGDIIILHMCTKNHNHMMYGSWDTEWDRQNFLSFWAIFCPFSPLTTWKIKILKLKKTPGDIIILHICTINDNHMMYGSWDMEHNRQNFLSFWTIFCPFTPTWTQKIHILEKWTRHLKITGKSKTKGLKIYLADAFWIYSIISA